MKLKPIILESKEDAELVLEHMKAILNKDEVVFVADLYDMVDLRTTYLDNKWGWFDLINVPIRQTEMGYLIDLPAPELIYS